MKSSHPDLSFPYFVRCSLDAVRREVLWAYDGLQVAIGRSTAVIVVDGEPAAVSVAPTGHVRVTPEWGPADVVCTTTSAAILDLIRGRDTLLDAIEGGRVNLVGRCEALLDWIEVLDRFLDGAVRARSMDSLLSDFERWTGAKRER